MKKNTLFGEIIELNFDYLANNFNMNNINNNFGITKLPNNKKITWIKILLLIVMLI